MSKTPKAPAQYPLYNFRAEPELMQGLDELRRDEPDLPTRSEMLRRVIRRAVDEHTKGRKPKR